MAGKFDTTMKALVEAAPQDWLALLGGPPGEARVIDADVSTVVGAEADKVLRVEGPAGEVQYPLDVPPRPDRGQHGRGPDAGG